MFLAFHARKHDLRQLINRLQEKLHDKTREISDLQQYAAAIGDGSVTVFDMANVPTSMFGRSMMYMQYSHNMALQNSQMNFMQMQPVLTQQIGGMDANAQQQYMAWVQQNLYKQERDRIAKQEAKLLNEQEKRIQQEKDKIETQLKMAEQELESVQKAEEKGIQQFAPKYVA